MSASIVWVSLVVGFATGLLTGALTAYLVLVTWSRIEGVICEVAQRAWPF